jgi:hypothetical protein
MRCYTFSAWEPQIPAKTFANTGKITQILLLHLRFFYTALIFSMQRYGHETLIVILYLAKARVKSRFDKAGVVQG